jgi:F0F1-type ATP synthase assembly protein I
MYFQFANVLVFFVITFLFVGALLALASLLRPANPMSAASRRPGAHGSTSTFGSISSH